MSSAKHRSKHASADRSSTVHDVAKNPPKGGSSPTAGGWIESMYTGVFYLLVIGGLGVTAWYLHTLSDQLRELHSRNQELSLQNQEFREGVETALQQVSSLKTTVGAFESSLKETQKDVDIANLSVRKSEDEVTRIGEVLQKVQNEILRDLSDGIQDVKAAREKDFTSLENTVEERLTELTKSINENIAVFTDVQERSQHEINDIKSKIDSAEISLLESELKATASQISDLHVSSEYKDEAIASLKKAVDLLDATAQDRGQEFTSFLQGYDDFKQSVESEHSILVNIRENISKIQAAIDFVSEEVRNLKEDLQQAKSGTAECEYLLSKARELLEAAEKNYEKCESSLGIMNEKVESMNSVTTVQSEKIESVILKQEEMETTVASLEKTIDVKSSLPEGDNDFSVASFQSTLQNLTESQESIFHDLDLLKSVWKKLQDAPTAHAIPEFQDKLQALADSQKQQVADLQADFDERLELLRREMESGSIMPVKKLPSIESSVNELHSSVAEAQSDLQTLRTTVDSLVAYSERIENNEKNLESTEDKLEELREELNKMVEKLETILEKV